MVMTSAQTLVGTAMMAQMAAIQSVILAASLVWIGMIFSPTHE
jgi:energy-converting hydrogenase Eha subunit B